MMQISSAPNLFLTSRIAQHKFAEAVERVHHLPANPADSSLGERESFFFLLFAQLLVAATGQ